MCLGKNHINHSHQPGPMHSNVTAHGLNRYRFDMTNSAHTEEHVHCATISYASSEKKVLRLKRIL